MFVAVLIPVIFVWALDMDNLSVVYLQYTLGGCLAAVASQPRGNTKRALGETRIVL